MQNITDRKNRKISSITIYPVLAFISALLLLSGCTSGQVLKDTVKERDSLANNIKLLQNRLAEMELQKKSLGSKLDATSGELTMKERELIAKSDALEKSNITLNIRNEELESTIKELRNKSEALRSTTAELESASEILNKNRELYDSLVADLQGELSANQIKIKEMKDGISLNLAQEILFDSGSAILNNSGEEVITKVSDQLKDISYNTIVAGFTDNVPIKGSLAAKYPTNWELAGARAASVVKLLESNGVGSNKLRAVSYGENQPVASNDTPDGKAQNRRIEILLKPIE